jgi:pimeloyl-ACP methyl ester carboxylesterase
MNLLLVHGVGGRPRSWRRVLEALDPALRRNVITADVRPERGQALEDIAQRLLDSHPGSHVIVGHSLGGMLALEAALIDASRVLGLVLVSAIPGTNAGVAAHNEALAADIEDRGIRIVAAEFADRLFAPGRPARSPDLKTDFIDAMDESGIAPVCAALRAIGRWDAADRLATLTCPAEVITGDAEPDIERQQKLASLLQAPFEILDDTGHLAPLEAPDRVAVAIKRLANRIAPRSADQRP